MGQFGWYFPSFWDSDGGPLRSRLVDFAFWDVYEAQQCGGWIVWPVLGRYNPTLTAWNLARGERSIWVVFSILLEVWWAPKGVMAGGLCIVGHGWGPTVRMMDCLANLGPLGPDPTLSSIYKSWISCTAASEPQHAIILIKKIRNLPGFVGAK